jgi:hypothetical protein
MSSKKFEKKFTVEENPKRVSVSKFEWATSTSAPSRKFKTYNRKLADSAAGVAPNTYSRPIDGKALKQNTLPVHNLKLERGKCKID